MTINRNQKPTTECSYCHKDIYKTPFELNGRGSKRFFCNKNCRNLFQKGSNHSQYKSVKVICTQCGKDIYLQPHRIRKAKQFFCDRKCKGQYMAGYKIGIRDINYKHNFNIVCEFCGQDCYQKPSQINNFNHHFCCQSCYSAWNISENHSRWIKDRSQLLSSIRQTVVTFGWYYKWVKGVYKRDRHQCKLCYRRNCKVNAHHIVTFVDIIATLSSQEIDLLISNKVIPNILIDMDNGITLCEKCHRGIKGNENEYKEFFKFINKGG